MLKLPQEVYHIVLSYLSEKDLRNLSLVSKVTYGIHKNYFEFLVESFSDDDMQDTEELIKIIYIYIYKYNKGTKKRILRHGFHM